MGKSDGRWIYRVKAAIGNYGDVVEGFCGGESTASDVIAASEVVLALVTAGRCPECGHELVCYTNGDRHCECGYFDEDGDDDDEG